MKPYINQLLDGWHHIGIEVKHPGISFIFNGPDEGEIIPFEGNCREIYAQADRFIYEAYWQNKEDHEVYIQVNEMSDDGMLIMFYDHGARTYQYCERQFENHFNVFDLLNLELKSLVDSAKENGASFEMVGRCAIKPEVYKLNGGWLIFSPEIVYGKHSYGVDIIADTLDRAKEIETNLFVRLFSNPVSHRSRLERFNFNKYFEEYNGSEEANRLRHKYLEIIKRSYENLDFSEIFEYLDDECSWGGAKGKDAVIESLIYSAEQMRKNNYLHKCTLVQVGRPVAPLECNTKRDGSGKRVFVGLMYHQGEICMVDVSPRQTLFFRMSLSLNGKILSYYATLPSGDFHPI